MLRSYFSEQESDCTIANTARNNPEIAKIKYWFVRFSATITWEEDNNSPAITNASLEGFSQNCTNIFYTTGKENEKHSEVV